MMLPHTAFTALLALGSFADCLTIRSTCQTHSQPNPIKQQYPNSATGTLNGTVAVLPIPYNVARAFVPSQYPILTAAYQQWLPSLSNNMYPALLQTEFDHDLGEASLFFSIPDFSRASISFPFVDRLNDGHTSMIYNKHILISPQIIALLGSAVYGDSPAPATFQPPCDAYAPGPGGATTFSATSLGSSVPGINHTFYPLQTGDSNPYSIDFIKNITNQPQFSDDPLFCDNFIRLFNSSVTTGPYAPTPVKGTVAAQSPYFPQSTVFTDVYGYNVDNAFIENNYQSCSSLAGYSGTGSGD